MMSTISKTFYWLCPSDMSLCWHSYILGHAQPFQTKSGSTRNLKCFLWHFGCLCQASDQRRNVELWAVILWPQLHTCMEQNTPRECSTSELPDFCKILHVLLVCNKLFFVLKPFSAWYSIWNTWDVTKLRETQLMVAEPEDLNHYIPLSAYTVQGRGVVSPKMFLVH